jgi:hypothetical protein
MGVKMGLPQRDSEYHTYGDYLHWPEDVRYELIDGVAYLMAPTPTLARQDVVGEVYRQLANALAERPCRVYVAPVDVRLPKVNEVDADIDTVVQPELLVLCDPTKADRRGCVGRRIWWSKSSRPAPPAMTMCANAGSTSVPGYVNTGWCTPSTAW